MKHKAMIKGTRYKNKIRQINEISEREEQLQFIIEECNTLISCMINNKQRKSTRESLIESMEGMYIALHLAQILFSLSDYDIPGPASEETYSTYPEKNMDVIVIGHLAKVISTMAMAIEKTTEKKNEVRIARRIWYGFESLYKISQLHKNWIEEIEEEIPCRMHRLSRKLDKRKHNNLMFERYEIISTKEEEWIVCDIIRWNDREYLFVKPLSCGDEHACIMEVKSERMLPEMVKDSNVAGKVDSMFQTSWIFSD